jgi:DNA-binding NarL/FixJ family response regulator
MPRMLRDIIEDTVSDQTDMQVVACLEDRQQMLSRVTETDAEVVVLGMSDGDLPDESLHVFEAHPHLRLFGVTADGRRAFLYELRPQRSALGEISPQGLVEAIRGGGV